MNENPVVIKMMKIVKRIKRECYEITFTTRQSKKSNTIYLSSKETRIGKIRISDHDPLFTNNYRFVRYCIRLDKDPLYIKEYELDKLKYYEYGRGRVGDLVHQIKFKYNELYPKPKPKNKIKYSLTYLNIGGD